MPELKLSRIAVEMLLGAVLVDALHAALKDAEIAFNRVCLNVTANVVALAMRRKVLAHLRILAPLVRVDNCFFGDIFREGQGEAWP